MKKGSVVVCLVFALCLLVTAQVSAAGKGGYISGHFGFVSLEDSTWSLAGFADEEMSYNTGIAIMGAGGYDFGMFRLEGELSYAYSEVDGYKAGGLTATAVDGAIDATSLLVNGYFDIENRSPVTPYVMGGIGFSYVEMYDVVLQSGGTTVWLYDQDDTVFAYQLGAGVEFAFNDTVSMDVGYRYLATSDLDFSGIDVEYGGHRILVGVRATF